jgi:hypothetical protein
MCDANFVEFRFGKGPHARHRPEPPGRHPVPEWWEHGGQVGPDAAYIHGLQPEEQAAAGGAAAPTRADAMEVEAAAYAPAHGSSGVASRTRAAGRRAGQDGEQIEGSAPAPHAATPIEVEGAAAAPMEVEQEGDGRRRAGLTRAGLIRAGLTTR